MFNKKAKEVDAIELGAELYLKNRQASKKELPAQAISIMQEVPTMVSQKVPILMEQSDDAIEEAKKLVAS